MKALAFGAMLLLAGCAGGYSANPVLAAKQQWVTGCKVADSNINTVTKLYLAGQIPESAAEKIDDVVDLYEAVCTGDPPAPGEPIQSTIVRLLAMKVCPTLVPSGADDWVLTAIEAANCVAEGALLAESGQ